MKVLVTLLTKSHDPPSIELLQTAARSDRGFDVGRTRWAAALGGVFGAAPLGRWGVLADSGLGLGSRV